jgi:phosphonate transport system substrate-binding protein
VVVVALRVATFLASNQEQLYRYVAGQLATTLAEPLDFVVGEDFEQFLANDFDLAFACGFWYLQRSDFYTPLVAPVMLAAKYQSQPVYYVDLVVKSSSPATSLLELEQGVFGFNENNSFSGYQALLSELNQKLGRGFDFFSQAIKTGSHFNSIEAVLSGQVDCTAIDSTVLDAEFVSRPALAPALKTVQLLGPYPAPPLLIRASFAENRRTQLLETLLTLPQLANFKVKHYAQVTPDFYTELVKPKPLAETPE